MKILHTITNLFGRVLGLNWLYIGSKTGAKWPKLHVNHISEHIMVYYTKQRVEYYKFTSVSGKKRFKYKSASYFWHTNSLLGSNPGVKSPKIPNLEVSKEKIA